MSTLRVLKRIVPVAVALAIAMTGRAADPTLYHEPFRPQFHFTPERNWMNDPNGLVFYGGEYHLFYQYNPVGDKWGHMSWGHAVSRDLVHWQHLPLALAEENGVMIFSGSAVVDWKNTSGFGGDGKPPLVAIYTGFRPADGRQFQCIASSNDKGRTWTKFSGNPVLDINSKEFRDPKVFWHKPTGRWVMTVSMATDRKIRFYGSPDLKQWTQLSEFGPAGATNGVWECPDLFPARFEQNPRQTNWVLTVNVSSGAPTGGSGGQYFVGKFDGTNFVADSAATPRWLDYGPDLYATVSWSGLPDDRRVILGWMTSLQYAGDVPTSPWRSVMSLPREVMLRRTITGVELAQQPIVELKSLRETNKIFRTGTISDVNGWLKVERVEGNGLEIDVDFESVGKEKFGLRVGEGTNEFTVIGWDGERERLFLDRTHSGKTDFNPNFAGKYEAPLQARHDRFDLHIFVDASSVEVFGNDGQVVLTALVFPNEKSRGITFWPATSSVKVKRLDIWKLSSAWEHPAKQGTLKALSRPNH